MGGNLELDAIREGLREAAPDAVRVQFERDPNPLHLRLSVRQVSGRERKREREREKEGEIERECVCVCVRERDPDLLHQRLCFRFWHSERRGNNLNVFKGLRFRVWGSGLRFRGWG